MNDHPLQHLHDFYFDRLESNLRPIVQTHLHTCSDCASKLTILEKNAADVPALVPRIELQNRLFQSLNQLERFSPYAERLGQLVDLSPNAARRALHAFADIDSWTSQPLPGMRAVHVPSKTKRAIFACLDPSVHVPSHRHLERESILVFQGAFETDSGRVIQAGEELHSERDSVHAITRILNDTDCLCVIVNPDRIAYEKPPWAGEGL